MSVLSNLFSFLFPQSRHETIVLNTTDTILRDIVSVRTIAGVTTLLPYKHEVAQALLWRAKYAEDIKAIDLLATLLTEHTSEGVTIVPIPLHPARLRERGYNQVERIAVAAKKINPDIIVSTDLLVRTRSTPRQTELKRKDRLENMKDAFRATEPQKSGVSSDTPLLLLDDITTTGTTLHEAKQTLEQADYTCVTRLALAH